jgi:predicted molibdopterin-dependent oxidoreductase YjgC
MSLFKQHSQQDGQTVTIEFEGTALQVPEMITVAAAVLSHGGKNHTRRSPASGEKRAPYCFMGVCHECLMEIDGNPNQQACIVQVQEGMKIRRQLELPGGDQ